MPHPDTASDGATSGTAHDLWGAVLEAAFDDDMCTAPAASLDIIASDLQELQAAEALYSSNPLSRRLVSGDPVLAPLPEGMFISRSSVAMVELDQVFGILSSLDKPPPSAGSPTPRGAQPQQGHRHPRRDKKKARDFHFADIEAGIGGWTEGLCYLRSKGWLPWASKVCGIGMSSQQFEVTSGGYARYMSNAGSFPYTGVDGTSDVCAMSNISGLCGTAKLATNGVGLDLCLGGVDAGLTPRQKKAYTVARALTSMLTVREGGAAVLHLPDIASEFSMSLLYILRLSFDDVHVASPRVLLPTATASGYAICLGKHDPPSFQGVLAAAQGDPLTCFLYRVLMGLAGSAGPTAACLVSKRLLAGDAGFREWAGGAVGAVLRRRAVLLRTVAERRGRRAEGLTSAEEEERFAYYTSLGLASSTHVPQHQYQQQQMQQQHQQQQHMQHLQGFPLPGVQSLHQHILAGGPLMRFSKGFPKGGKSGGGGGGGGGKGKGKKGTLPQGTLPMSPY